MHDVIVSIVSDGDSPFTNDNLQQWPSVPVCIIGGLIKTGGGDLLQTHCGVTRVCREGCGPYTHGLHRVKGVIQGLGWLPWQVPYSLHVPRFGQVSMVHEL